MIGFAQDNELSLSFEEKKLSYILHQIENEYGILFSYKDAINEDELKSLTVSGRNKDELLKNLFNALNLEFRIIDDNQIVLNNQEGNNQEDNNQYKCGIILDDLSGVGLAFANIISEDSIIGIGADENGIFQLPFDIDSNKKFNVSYIGYDKSQFIISDLKQCKTKQEVLNNPTAFNVKLKLPEFSTPFLVIKEYITDGIDLNQNGFSTNIKPTRIGALPGQVEPDVMKTIQFLPGVNSPSSKASDIFIRGGTPDQNLILWEDIPIYHSAHYFGMISAVDPFVISEMNVFRGGFDASYGGRAAGVIDMKSFGLDHNRDFINIGSNLVNSYINGKNGFGKKTKNNITYSVRRSFAEAWESPTFQAITRNNQQGLVIGSAEIANTIDRLQIKNDFDFLDTHIKFSSQLTDKTRLNIAGIYATNSFNGDIVDDQLGQSQQDTMNLQNQGLSIQLAQKWSPSFSSELKAIATSYNYEYNYLVKEFQDDKTRLEGMKSNEIIDQQIQFSSSYQFPKKQSINFGYQYTDYDISFKVLDKRRGGRDIDDKATTQSYLHAAYASFKNPISNKIGIDAGVRMNYYEASKRFYWEPRIKLSYQIFESFSLHANYGKHHQFIGQVSNFRGSENGISTPIWRLSENKTIPIIEAEQLQFGLIFSKQNWVLDFQVYYKEIIGLSSSSYDFENDEEGDNQSIGKSNSTGFDVLIKKRFNKQLNFWASYSYSKVEMEFKEISKQPFPSDFDQPHNLKISTQYKINDFEFATGFNFSSGLGYTEITEYDITQGGNQTVTFDIDYGKINDQRLSNLMELNISGRYAFVIPQTKSKAHISASVSNMLNRKNIYNRSFYIDVLEVGPAKKQTLDKFNLPRTINCSIRIEI